MYRIRLMKYSITTGGIIMKKSILAFSLALSMLIGIVCFAIPASAARLAPYLSQYEEVAIPADDDIAWSYNNIAIWLVFLPFDF